MQKEVTKLLIILIGLIFLSVGFISAASCDVRLRTECQAGVTDPWNNTIMGLSGSTNAHGELASEGNYDYVLCCDFGTGDTNCYGKNKIIGLSSPTNAHAEIPSETTYTTDVCYEDLSCINITGDCPVDPKGDYYPLEMVSLSNYTNAHLAEFSHTYTTKICCSSDKYAAPPCTLGSSYWSLDGVNPITETYSTALNNQNVSLIVEGTNCNGETISFEVLEYDTGGSTPATTNPEDVIFGANAIGTWTAEWMDDGLLQYDPEYYFIASVIGGNPVESLNPQLTVTLESVDEYCLDQGISSCEGYSEEYCNADPCLVADTSGAFCEDQSCSCSWDDTEGLCKISYSSVGECGDGVISLGETCDGTNWGPITGCTNFDEFDGGTLSCTSSCNFNTSLCTGGTSGTCGDGNIDTGETCDGTNWGPITGCTDFDEFGGGTLSCSSSCNFDTSLCTGGEISGTCLITQTVESECDEEPQGLFIYSWTGIWDGDGTGSAYSQCTAGGEGDTIECPAQVQLPFFDFYNVIIALALIALIYILLILRRKQRKTSKKKSSGKKKGK